MNNYSEHDMQKLTITIFYHLISSLEFFSFVIWFFCGLISSDKVFNWIRKIKSKVRGP
jgi:hypothetical protein